MTEVVPADRTRLLHSKRAECSAIARSRKRKLCILYEVTVNPDALPRRSFNTLDAYEHTPAEKQFLDGCDILQGRTLNELNIPPRPRVRPNYAQYLSSQTTTSVSNENIPTPSKQTVPELPNTGVVEPLSLPSKTPVATSNAQPVAVPLVGTSGLVKPPYLASFTDSVRNVSTGPDPLPASVDRCAVEEKSQAVEATHKVPLSRQDANFQPEGVSSTSTTSFLQQTDSSRQSQALTPDLKGRQSLEQPPRRTSPMELDIPPSKNLISNILVPSQLPQPDSGRPPDIASSPSSTARTVATPTVLDVSTNTSPDRDGSLHAGRSESIVDSKKRSEDADKSHPSQSNHPTIRLEAPLAQPTTSQSIGEQVEAQLVRDSVSATTRGVASQLVGKVVVDRTSAQSVSPFFPSADATVPRSPRELPQVSEREHLNDTSGDRSKVGLAPNDVHQPEQNIVEDTVLGPTANSREEDFGKKSADDSAREKQTTHLNEQQQSITVPTSILPVPIMLREQDRGLTGSVTEVALQKPVAEILGERLESASDVQSPSDSQATQSMPITPTSQSSKARPRSLIGKTKKDKSKLSTVVFGKQPHRASNSSQLIQNRSKPDQLPTDDYYTTLFVNGFAASSKWMKPLDQLLHQAHKTVSTPDSYTQILDNQACRILRRVYQLQHNDKWSLRQPKRCPEPPRQVCHWDILLQEMKWMRTDFREERKWKMAAARNMAYDCAEWIAASEEERKALQVKSVIPPPVSKNAEDVLMVDAQSSQGPENHPTPDLIPSGRSDSPLEPDDELDNGFPNTVAPSAIFALQDDDIVFSLQPSAVTDRLLEELPMYGAPLKVPNSDSTAPDYDPDASWKRPALPLSRFVEGQMELTSSEPPKKRSRYQHIQEDEEDEEIIFGQDRNEPPQLQPQNPDVALFRTENKSIKDRLHAGHQFRPPSDNMPFQAFYDSRSSSLWTQPEDDELKSLVREYSYNWSLIFSILSNKSIFPSGADRRTPWECFERWVMLEGLPHDMQKTQYFKLWQSRIDQSQVHLRQLITTATAQQAQQQQQSQQAQQPSQATPNGPSTPLPRLRRHSLPMKVDRRRNNKHIAMIDTMRRLAKKRETAAQKQQQTAQLAAARKTATDVAQPKAPTKTPREYSIMRWERDQAMAERLAERMAQQQRHEAQRRAAIQRVQQSQHAHMAAATQSAGQLPQGTPQMATSHPHAAMARVNNPNHITANGQARPRIPMPMPSTPNGAEHPTHMTGGLVPPMQMNGSPQIQMPVVNGQAQMSMPTSAHSMHMLLQARRISEQQRQSVQMRQQQQHQQPQQQQQQQQQHPQQQPQPHPQQQPLAQQQQPQQAHANQQVNPPLQTSPPAMRAAAINGLNQKNYLNNAQVQAMMASFNTTNGSGLSTPPAAGFNVTAGQSASPRPNVIIPPQHQTYLSQLQAIENQIRSNHPDTPQDRVREMAKTYLQNKHNTLTQSAMNAAAGSPGQAAAANGPHQYAQLLRAQQQQQAAAAAAAAAAQAQAQAQAQSQQVQQVQVSQQSAQHHRNSSGSATPTPSNPK